MPSIPLFKIFVDDLDTAVGFYVGTLGMELIEDRQLGDYRWLLVGYPEQPGFGLNLDLARSEEEKAIVGQQAARQPLFSIATEDCARDYEMLLTQGVAFDGPPKTHPWGTAVTFRDVVGNRIHLSQEAS